MTPISCYIYRCSAKADMYIYLSEEDDFDCLPDELQKNLGQIEFSMEIELGLDKKLAQENTETVMDNLKKQGFHIQMPANTPIDQLLENIAKDVQQQQVKT
jgi:uncharacterized protein